MVDAGLVWDAKTAIHRARAFSDYNIFWLEEPLARDDYEGPARLRRDSCVQRFAGRLRYIRCDVTQEAEIAAALGVIGLIAGMNRGEDFNGRPIDAPTSFFVGVAVNPTADDLDRERDLTLSAQARQTIADIETALGRLATGSYGYSTEFDVERYFRDAPLMIVGEGTNEIQRNVIARQLVQRHPASS